MAKQLDQVLVVDLEATCWEGSPPPGARNETIEVGLCVLDLGSLERVEQRSFLVRPQVSQVSAFCTQLTTLRPEDVAEAPPLSEVCQILRREYQGPRRLWASYGDYDRRQLERDCREQGAPYPFGPSHLNVKTLFALARGLRREVGMAQALEVLGLPLEGTHHRGVDDAFNIAGILAWILARTRSSPGSPASTEG